MDDFARGFFAACALWTVVALIILVSVLTSGGDIKKETHFLTGEIETIYVDGTMASLVLKNVSDRGKAGITFYPTYHDSYSPFDFELLEENATYTFVFHLEDNVARPGIEMYYIDNAPVIDGIHRGNHSGYYERIGLREW